MINGRNFFDQPVKNYIRTCDNIRKITTGQGDDYATGCLLDYPYFKKSCKMITTDLKVVSTTFFLVWLLCPTESTCERRKNVFYFSLKVLFALEINKF